MIYKIKSFFRYLKKILDYAIFLRNDQDYDYTYILSLLEYKLSRTRKEIQRNNIVASTPQIVKNIRTAELLLRRLRKNEYADYLTDELYGEKGVLETYSKATPEEKEFLTKQIKRISAYEEYMWNQDYDFLTKHLKKHLRSWWD